MTFLKTTAAFCTIATLAACGGGGDDPIEEATFENLTTSTETAIAIQAFQQVSGGFTVSSATGTYDATTDIATIDSSDISSDGASDLTGSLSYVAALSGAGDNRIVIAPTAAADVPTGAASYTGRSQFTVVVAGGANAGTYDGEMDVTLDISIGSSSSATLTIDGLVDGDATVTPVGSPTAAYTATGSEEIVFNGLSISGGTISDGGSSTASVTGFGDASESLNLTGASIDVIAGLAGPAAEEMGGVGTINDATAGSVRTTFSGSK